MGATGATGVVIGATGATGPTGPTGQGIVGWEIVSTSATDSDDKTLTVTCAGPGNSVLGGGFRVTAQTASDRQKLSVIQNYPSANTTWTVMAVETVTVNNTWTLDVYAVCGVA
jgi:hypothetical protein